MSRLFYALCPDPATRASLVEISKAIKKGNLTTPENLHITLLYLGQVDRERRHDLITMTTGITTDQFKLVLTSCGWWKRARVLWLAPAEVPQQILDLVSGLSSLAKRHNLSIEDRPYLPHVTLARKISQPIEIEIEPISWQVREFSLLESTSSPRGVEYKIIHTWPLT